MILDGTLDASVQTAARALQQGQLLGLPTETVYGLAADSDNDAAVAQIFVAKGQLADDTDAGGVREAGDTRPLGLKNCEYRWGFICWS